MVYRFLEKNAEIIKAKGDIPYWIIASQLGVHENTIRNWMKREVDPVKKVKLLKVIEEIKQEYKEEA